MGENVKNTNTEVEIDKEEKRKEIEKLEKEINETKLDYHQSLNVAQYFNKLYLLGLYYYEGNYVPKDYKKAFEIFTKASNHDASHYPGYQYVNYLDFSFFSGSMAAQYYLAKMYIEGKGCEKNILKAFEYFNKCCNPNLHQYVEKFDSINKVYKLDPYYPAARDWHYEFILFMEENKYYLVSSGKISFTSYEKLLLDVMKLAIENNTNAQYKYACWFKEGYLVSKSIEESFAWFKEAADNGHLDAMLEVAKMYETGEGTLTDINMAIEYYRKAANKGHIPSKVILAKKYATGDYLEKNYLEAIKLYEECINENNKYESEIGECYYNYALTLSLNESIKYLKLAIENNYSLAKEKLGEVYYILGENSSKEESLKWYQLSIEYGNDKAKDKLKEYYFNLANEATNKDKLYWY